MVNDPIADMINRMKTVGLSGQESLTLPYSQLKEGVAEALKAGGFLKGYKVLDGKGVKKLLMLELITEDNAPKIRGAKRLSKPSKRVYKKSSEIRSVKNGYGLLILSTPQGVMSGTDAKKAGVGGEALFTIW